MHRTLSLSPFPIHLRALISFSLYIYIYIYICLFINIYEKENFALDCVVKGEGEKVNHTFSLSPYTFESSHLLLLSPLIYIYIYTHTHTHRRKLCAQLRREGRRKGALHVSPFSLPYHIWELSFPSPFSSYIYIYITLPGLILKQSTFKVPLILIPEVSQKRTQIMKQSHIMGFATNLLSFTNMVAITNLLGILMVVTTQIRWL